MFLHLADIGWGSTEGSGVSLENVDVDINKNINISEKTSTIAPPLNQWLPYTSENELQAGDLICDDKGHEMRVTKISNGYVDGTIINETKPRPGYCVLEDVALYKKADRNH